ncbi:MAG: FHA domain-containing protein [Deltaproteobacteria bacterium]|nr:FHA domain-containing protein [Deltaproteobacteria bacterium]
MFAEFEARAVDLGCTVDWLLAEAMQRVLAETRSSANLRAASVRATTLPPSSSAISALAARDPDAAADLAATEEWTSNPAPESDNSLGAAALADAARPAREPGADPRDMAIALSLGDRRMKVDRDPFVIGRRAEAGVHFVIEQEGVSRRHAMLERGESGWVIFDLGSTNGLLVNGNFVAGAPIRPGDMISLGSVLLVVEQA